MAHEIVFDIETIGDIQDLQTMKVTVVSLYDFGTDSFHSFTEHELTQLWPFFERAERIIGFNSEHFDVPILQRSYSGDFSRFRHLDLLKVVKESTGKRFKLDDLARATLQMQKSASGLQAVEWYKQGEIDKIKEYCEQDVRVTKELYEFGRKNRMLYYPTLTGDLIPFPVNFDMPTVVTGAGQPQGSGINLTLPF